MFHHRKGNNNTFLCLQFYNRWFSYCTFWILSSTWPNESWVVNNTVYSLYEINYPITCESKVIHYNKDSPFVDLAWIKRITHSLESIQYQRTLSLAVNHNLFFWNIILQPQIKNNKDKKKLSMPLNSFKTKLQNSLLKKNQNSWNVSSNTSDTLRHFVE